MATSEQSCADVRRTYRVGEFELDPIEETLFHSGKRINLNRRTFQVLSLLIEYRGQIVAKEQFFSKVWNGSFVEDNNLTVAVAGLRRVLGDNAKEAKFIENIPRKGYRFIASVTVSSQNGITPADVEVQTPDPQRSKTVQRMSVRRATVWSGAGLFFIALAAGAVALKKSWDSAHQPLPRITSVAVLPFQCDGEEDSYVSLGITDGIIADLAGTSGLSVIDRNSSNKLRDRVFEPVAVGRELNVSAVITGKVEVNGDVMLVSASLRDVATNTEIWHQLFRRQKSESFLVPREISNGILSSTGYPKIQQGHSETAASIDHAAFDEYLKGRYFLDKRTNVAYARAADHFKNAVDKDPTFARAYAGLADAYTLGGLRDPRLSAEEKNSLIRSAIEKALEIDPNLGHAYASRAINRCYYEWDWAGAEKDYRRAIDLDPNDATAHHWYAEFLSMHGRFEESIFEYEKAAALDPFSLPIKADMAFSYFYSGKIERSIELLEHLKKMNPNFVRAYEYLVLAYREKGDFVADIENQSTVARLQFEGNNIGADHYQDRQKYVNVLRTRWRNGPLSFWRAELNFGDPDYTQKSICYAKLGERDLAFQFLQKALREHSTGLVWLKVSPEFNDLRSDPRFDDLLRRVGFQS